MIAVTGASGFIGKHLCEVLGEQFGNENVLCLSSQKTPYGQFLFHENYSFGDDFFLQQGYSNIETVIHAGAFIPKSKSEANDSWLCQSNISSTLALLSAQLPSLKKFVFLSTVDVYQFSEIINESTLINPATLYGASKWYGEKLVEAAAKEKGFDAVILRLGHIYGPGEEKFKKIIPELMKNILSGEDVHLQNAGQDVRSFLYIKDLVRYLQQACDNRIVGGPVNLVGQSSVSMLELAKKIIAISGKEVNLHITEAITSPTRYIYDRTLMETFFNGEDTALMEGLQEEWAHMKKVWA